MFLRLPQTSSSSPPSPSPSPLSSSCLESCFNVSCLSCKWLAVGIKAYTSQNWNLNTTNCWMIILIRFYFDIDFPINFLKFYLQASNFVWRFVSSLASACFFSQKKYGFITRSSISQNKKKSADNRRKQQTIGTNKDIGNASIRRKRVNQL